MRFRCQPRSRGTWDKVQKSGPRGSARRFTVFYLAYACGELIFPLGEATGVHGLPGVGLIPGLPGEVPPLLFSLPGLDGFELDDPEFGEEPDVPLVVPGTVPHGEPLGEPPGLFGVLGLMVEGCVVLPGVGLAGEFAPGTVAFGFPLGELVPGVAWGVPTGGVAVPAGGVAVPAGGVAVRAGGVAGEAGAELCPAVPEPPAGAPPEGALCATAQLPQHNTTESNANFGDDMIFWASRP